MAHSLSQTPELKEVNEQSQRKFLQFGSLREVKGQGRRYRADDEKTGRPSEVSARLLRTAHGAPRGGGQEEGVLAMDAHRIYSMPFATVYPLYVAKVERKGRTQAEVDEIIQWLTGYDAQQLNTVLENKVDFESFFAEAPTMNPSRSLITGVICGVRVEEIDEPLMQEIRYLDKLIDEIARGKPMQKVLRA